MKQIIFTIILIFACSFWALAQTSETPCPKISLIGPQELINIDEITQFNVEVSKEAEENKIEYQWTASIGKIIEGQGTPEIKFSAGSENAGSNFIVSVKLIGLPENCANSVSGTFAARPPIIDRFYDMFGELPKKNYLYGRLDNFFVALRNDPTSEGLVVLEFDKKEKRAEKIKRLNEISKHLKFRKFDRTRLSFLIVEADKEYTRLYIVPAEAEITQVISESEVQNIIKGEVFDQKIKELFPKK
jgi:hypothetical protein